jgi:hypothetical protein
MRAAATTTARVVARGAAAARIAAMSSAAAAAPPAAAGAKLWGGRFTGATDPLMEAFNNSIAFDRRMWRQDIAGSVAYARALGRAGLLSDAEVAAITTGLGQVRERGGGVGWGGFCVCAEPCEPRAVAPFGGRSCAAAARAAVVSAGAVHAAAVSAGAPRL